MVDVRVMKCQTFCGTTGSECAVRQGSRPDVRPGVTTVVPSRGRTDREGTVIPERTSNDSGLQDAVSVGHEETEAESWGCPRSPVTTGDGR